MEGPEVQATHAAKLFAGSSFSRCTVFRGCSSFSGWFLSDGLSAGGVIDIRPLGAPKARARSRLSRSAFQLSSFI